MSSTTRSEVSIGPSATALPVRPRHPVGPWRRWCARSTLTRPDGQPARGQQGDDLGLRRCRCPGDDQRIPAQPRRIHRRRRSGQPVVRGHDDLDRLPPQQRLRQFGCKRLGRRRQHRQDETLIGVTALPVGPAPFGQREPHAGMPSLQVVEHPREERGADARCGQHGQRLVVHGPQQADRRSCRTDLRKDVAGVVGEHSAGRGHAGRPARPVDQAHAEVALQGRDVRADPGLGPMDLRGGSREPTPVDDGEKRLQPVQLHAVMMDKLRNLRPRAIPQERQCRYPRKGFVDPCSGWFPRNDALAPTGVGCVC